MIHPPLCRNFPGLLHGGDYNPEQWTPEIWDADDALMPKAQYSAVTLGVFSWVSLEPEEGQYSFEWLDNRMDAQAKAGRAVILATPSAAMPAWMSRKYPEVLRTGADKVQRMHGIRVNYCWSSPVYREKTAKMARVLAERYKDHPALAMWHVSNELGGTCYCDLCQDEFRAWLRQRYGSLEALNAAYWTAFWSHTYTSWDQVEIPNPKYGEHSINAMALDFRRFTSDQMIRFYRNEADELRAITPDIPITTNLMGTYPELDSRKIAPYLDVASWDSYPFFAGKPTELSSWLHASFCHDLNRALKNKPFLLMECSPSSSNWYPVMALKRPNMHVLEGLQAVAHGADGVQYFQWRMGRGSSEQFHGAVVAHNQAEDARVFQEVAQLGQILKDLSDVAGTETTAEVGLIYDWEVNWAVEAAHAPRIELRNYNDTVKQHYQSFWQAGISVDVIGVEADLSRYKLIVAPMLFAVSENTIQRLAAFVEQGGTLVTTYWSGIVNETMLAYTGGGNSTWRDLFGLWNEEIDALYEGDTVEITWGNQRYQARELCELVRPIGCEVLGEYASEFYAGRPALTRNRYGSGTAYYVASRNDQAFHDDFLLDLCARLDIEPAMEGEWPAGVTVQRRGDYLFVLNCTSAEVEIRANGEGLQSIVGAGFEAGTLTLPAFGSAVLKYVSVAAPVA